MTAVRVNALGEFVDDAAPRRTRVRTDSEQREELLAALRTSGIGVCDVCGRVFKVRHPRQLRCGRFACKQEANRRRARMNMRELRSR